MIDDIVLEEEKCNLFLERLLKNKFPAKLQSK